MDRIVTISALTSALAHEINQPLSAMRSYAQAALRFMDKDQPEYDSVRKALQGIVADNKRAAAVVNRLRDLVKKGKAHREMLDINSIINDVVGLINSEIVLRNASITLDLHPIVPVVHGDSIQIQQVLLNLLTNALDALDNQPFEARTIIVSTRPENSNATLYRFQTREGASLLIRYRLFLILSIRQNPMEWVLGSPSVNRSLKPMAGEFGQLTTRKGGRRFI